MEGDKEKIRFVVDTNILMSALLKDDSSTAKLLKSEFFEIYYPENGLREIECYKDYIISKRKKTLQMKSFDYALKFIFESICIIPSELYSLNMKIAYEAMKDIDEKDAPFLALALQLDCPIWSNDTHFKQQSIIKAYATVEIVQMVTSQ